MCKFKIKLLHNEEMLFCTFLLNFKFTLPLAKLYIAVSRPVSNSLIFSDDTPVDIELVTFLLLSNISKLSTEAETTKF